MHLWVKVLIWYVNGDLRESYRVQSLYLLTKDSELKIGDAEMWYTDVTIVKAPNTDSYWYLASICTCFLFATPPAVGHLADSFVYEIIY